MKDNSERELANAICMLACTLKDVVDRLENKALLDRIAHLERNIMSAISDFATKQNAFNDRVDAAVTGLTEDVQTLNDKITELQNSPGGITPEDQALLDAIEARSASIATKLEALDALTPPKPPVA